MFDQFVHAIQRSFLQDESGAGTVDWVVLCAATLTLGFSAMTLVQTGAISLGNEINIALRSSLTSRAEFGFYRLTGQQQRDMLAVYTSRTPEQLIANSEEMSESFLAALESGNLDEAARWMDRRHLNQTALEASGLAADDGSLTVSEMERLFRDAGGT